VKQSKENENSSADNMTIDTSKMSAGKRAAVELTESSRDAVWQYPTFAGALFMGKIPWRLVYPFPEQSLEDRLEGDRFLAQLERYLRDHTDPEAIDNDGEIPDAVFEGLAKLGAFGIKIPRQYGGLGLSQTNYSRAAVLLGSHCGNLTALLSAHQSIGVPQPLMVFGTPEQKARFLPRVAAGEISAFALTERSVGSDPAKMKTVAEPVDDGSAFILNGEKLWCTNGTRAGLMVVMARTPPSDTCPRGGVTAFIVESNAKGVAVTHRCRFMGLRALYNGVIRFTNVRVPRENIILAEGKGLKVALTTLNTGRLTLPSACIGLSKRCLEIVRSWSNNREQWGSPIGHHSAIADKIAQMAADTFAMESMTLLTSALVDRKESDIRVEAAMCKLWGTEAAWRIVDETMQIRGGRGYECERSLRERGETPIGVERFMRDCRINTLFEGSSEIMRLFIAREALDPHLRVGGAVMNSQLPVKDRLKAAVRAIGFYARWYPKQLMPVGGRVPAELDRRLRPYVRYSMRCSRRLARTLFHSMAKHGASLEREQMLLGRLVDVGTELFVISAVCSRAQHLLQTDGDADSLMPLVEQVCRDAIGRIDTAFRGLRCNDDRRRYRLARDVLEKRYSWLEDGIVAEWPGGTMRAPGDEASASDVAKNRHAES
jgi:alkylation response protein AidB-like acyl-CoA dehydrogenase